MGYGLYLADIETFDDLIDWLEDHINEIVATLNTRKQSNDIRKNLKKIIEDNYVDEIEEYGWTEDEELPDLIAVNMFHEVFSTYNKRLYLQWFKLNYEEFQDESVFNYEEIDSFYDELNQFYKDEGQTLSNKLYKQEMKRGLYAELFRMIESLDYSLKQEANIVSLLTKGELGSNEVYEEVKDIIEKISDLEN